MIYKSLNSEDKRRFRNDFTKEFLKSFAYLIAGLLTVGAIIGLGYLVITWKYGIIVAFIVGFSVFAGYRAKEKATKRQQKRDLWRESAREAKESCKLMESYLSALTSGSEEECKRIGCNHYIGLTPKRIEEEEKYLKIRIEHYTKELFRCEQRLKEFED